nr:SH3 and multiple ankyrin repeat domains protein [Hymenolepis microstoma]
MTNNGRCLWPNLNSEANNLSLKKSIADLVLSTSVAIENLLPVPQKIQIGVRCPTTGAENIFFVKSTESVGHLRRLAVLQSFSNVKEALNFGLYLPPKGSKKGKFLEDQRPIFDYPVLLQDSGRRSRDNDNTASNSTNTLTDGIEDSPDSGVEQDRCWLELAFKGRMDIDDSQNHSRIRKLKTKVTQNHFMDMVRNHDVKGIEKILTKGFDPNFCSRKDGEAPITAAATIYHPRDVIIALVNGGAHVDFRAQDSHTALHRAAICGNYEAIQTLLDLGQNPNCRDWVGLTPLYYAVSTDISARCTHALLYDHAIIGVKDENGFEEIHQACKANQTHHLENLIAYGADLNARTKRGQTPLHLCVWHESNACLRQLLLRGADPKEVNDDNQTPLEYALLTNRNEQATILQDFDPSKVVAIRDRPSYNTSRRPTVNGPRGAVAYNYLHKSPLTNAGSASEYMAVLSPSESLFSVDRFSTRNIASPLATNGSVNCNGASNDGHANSNNSSFSHTREDYSGSLGGISKARITNFGGGKQATTSASSRMLMSPCNGGQEQFYTRTIAMRRGEDGFGFTLKGIPRNALIRDARQRLPSTPSNQYFNSVVPGGPADRAGARKGDYIVEIDGQDVTDDCHEDVVECIKNCGDSIIMRVTTVYRGSVLRQPNAFSNDGQITNTPRRYDLSDEMSEISEMSSSISESNASEDEVIHTTPTSPILALKPPSGSSWRGRKGCMPLTTEERSRSRDRKSLVPLQRTFSSGQIKEPIRLHSISPATRTKERVFVFEKINGITRAVPLEESKAKNEGHRSRSTVKFAGDQSPTQSTDGLNCSSSSDVETHNNNNNNNNNHRMVDVTIEYPTKEEKNASINVPSEKASSFFNRSRSISRSRLSNGSFKGTDQSIEGSMADRNISFSDD